MPIPTATGLNALLASANAGDLYTAVVSGYTVAGNWDWFSIRFPGFSPQVIGRGLSVYRQGIEAGQIAEHSGLDYLLDPGQIPRNPTIGDAYEYRLTVEVTGPNAGDFPSLTVMRGSGEIETYGQLGGTGGRQLAKILREGGYESSEIAIAWQTGVTVSIDYIFRR